MAREDRLVWGAVIGVVLGIVFALLQVVVSSGFLAFLCLIAGFLLFFLFMDKQRPWQGVRLLAIVSAAWLVFFETVAIIVKVLSRRLEALATPAQGSAELGAGMQLLDMFSGIGYGGAFVMALLTLVLPAVFAWLMADKKQVAKKQ